MDTRHPEEIFLRNIDVHELLPQQEPFVMIDAITSFDGTNIVTETTVKSDNIFVTDGVFSPTGLVENIAQTCAARIGYANKYILQKGIQIGVIGAIRNLHIEQCPHVGDLLKTSVTVIDEVFGMTLAKAVITNNGNPIVTTEIKIAVKDTD